MNIYSIHDTVVVKGSSNQYRVTDIGTKLSGYEHHYRLEAIGNTPGKGYQFIAEAKDLDHPAIENVA